MTQSIPPNYTYHAELFAGVRQGYEEKGGWYMLVWANFLALLPLGVGIFILWLPYQIYLFLGTPWSLFPDPSWTISVKLLVGASVIIASIFIHEWLHGLALQLMGYRPRYFIRNFVPHAGIQPEELLSRNHFLIMTLTPLVVLTLLGSIALLLLPPTLGQLLLITLLLNFAASVGDLFVAYHVRRWPPEALFADGGKIFLPIRPIDSST